MLKSYKTLAFPYYFNTFMVNGKEIPVTFNGTSSRPGNFVTSDEKLQEVLEKSPAYGRFYTLDWKKDIGQPSETKPPVIPELPQFQEIPGIDNFQTAKKYLIDNKCATPDQIPNKEALLQKCSALRIKFTDLK